MTIDCGFTTPPRFVMVKGVNATGDWVVFDSVRGFDKDLRLNGTIAERTEVFAVTSNGFIPSAGFRIQGFTWLYLAIA